MLFLGGYSLPLSSFTTALVLPPPATSYTSFMGCFTYFHWVSPLYQPSRRFQSRSGYLTSKHPNKQPVFPHILAGLWGHAQQYMANKPFDHLSQVLWAGACLAQMHLPRADGSGEPQASFIPTWAAPSTSPQAGNHGRPLFLPSPCFSPPVS